MKFIIKTDLPDALGFIKEQLDQFDTSRADWFKILPLSQRTRFHGRCYYPVRKAKYSRTFAKGYRIRCSVNIDPLKWPFTVHIPIGTWQKEIKGASRWGYEKKEARFNDANEALVFLAGHETYHFLRHSRQIPGKNTQVQADAYGLKWLEKFRG